MGDIRVIFENVYRLFMYKDELISLHLEIDRLMRRVHRQERVIRRMRAHDTLPSHQVRYIRRSFRMFLLLKAAPFYRNGDWIGLRKSDSLGLTERITPIIAMFRLCDWRRSTMMLHDIEHHTSPAFALAIRSCLLCRRTQSLERKVHRLLRNGAFKRDLDAIVPYLGASYRIRWRESDIRFDDRGTMDVAAFALPIRRVHSHVAFLHIACTEFCLLCGITDTVTHHALTESVLNTISIANAAEKRK